MDDEARKGLLLHVAGAASRHTSPFADLEVPATMDQPAGVDVERHVKPFYLGGLCSPGLFAEHYGRIRAEVDTALIRRLLSWVNWRPRKAAAYFVAIERLAECTDHIGRLLLRSDVCFAGKAYALALVCIETDAAIRYLQQYLEYYLDRLELEFDQVYVAAALTHVDAVRGTAHMRAFEDALSRFVTYENARGDRAHLLENMPDLFSSQLAAIQRVRAACVGDA